MASNLSFSLFYPLILLVLAWGALEVAARILNGRGRAELADNLQTLGFGAILLAAAYGAVMAVVATVQYPTRISDMALILLIVFVFFGALVGILLLLTEVEVAGRKVGVYVGSALLALMAVGIVLAIV